MDLTKKKNLASKALKVGRNRIVFNKEGIAEIKEAITKQDIKDLYSEGIISIKPMKGRRKIKKRKTRKGAGKIKMKVRHRKQDYVKITRKLRGYVKKLRNNGIISRELYWGLRKKIKMKLFKSLAHFKEHINNLENVNIRQDENKEKPKKTEKNIKIKKISKTKEQEWK